MFCKLAILLSVYAQTLKRSHFKKSSYFSFFLRSKLHLVDLAGSERVWKSHVPDISRPKFFNLSLHHLESVVTALQKFHPRNTETDSKKNRTKKCLIRGSSAFLSQPQNTGAAEMPRVNALLKSASTGQLGRQRRQSPFGVGYNPCCIPYRNSLLTMVLQDSLGESTEGFLQLIAC